MKILMRVELYMVGDKVVGYSVSDAGTDQEFLIPSTLEAPPEVEATDSAVARVCAALNNEFNLSKIPGMQR